MAIFQVTVPDSFLPSLEEYVRLLTATKYDKLTNVTTTAPAFPSVSDWIASQVAQRVRDVIERNPPADIQHKRQQIQNLLDEIEGSLKITVVQS